MNSEQELVFAKLLVSRRVATADAVKECFRAQTELAIRGRTVALESVLIERGVVARDALLALRAEFERLAHPCEACGAWFCPEDGHATLCRRCSGQASRAPGNDQTGAFRAARDGRERPRGTSGRLEKAGGAASPRSRSQPAGAPPGPADGARAAASGTARSGETFGEYEILETVARGGMGVVFKARHRSLDRIVALKVLREGRRSSDDHVRRFKREAQSAAKLQHPHIVRIHEFGHNEGQYFFTMDFVEGESFESFLANPERDLRRGVEILRDVARAVHFAHENGVIHRDLKPANILLDRKGEPRITDFGLARNVDHGSALTQEGELLGTPLYMSPEQVRGRVKEVDARSDVYALGVMLYQHLAGQLPFIAQTMVELQWKVVNEEPPPVRTLNPAIDPVLETIVQNCLEKAREDRYQTAALLAEDLEHWLGGERISARGLSAPGRFLRRVRRNRRAATGAAAIFIVLLAAGGIVGWSEWRARAETARALRARARLELESDLGLAAREIEAALEAARAELEARGPEAAERALADLPARLAEAERMRSPILGPDDVAALVAKFEIPRLRREYLRVAAWAGARRGGGGLAVARAALEDLIARMPEPIDDRGRAALAGAWTALARVRADLGESGAADVALKKALSIDARFGAALRLRGEAALARGDDAVADEALSAALAPGATGGPLPALSALEPAATATPDDVAGALLARAIARCRLRDDARALDDLREVLARRPTEPLVFVYRGEIALRKGDRLEAARDFDRAVDLTTDNPEPYVRRGRFELALGDYAGAAKDLQLAIDMRDSLTEAYLFRGVAAYYLGEDGAEDDLLRAARGDPEGGLAPDPATAREAWMWLGRLRRATRRADAAVEAYRSALALGPDDADGLVGLGRALLDAGPAHAAEAEALAEKAVRAGGGAIEPALVCAGLAAIAAADADPQGPKAAAERALAFFQRALELSPRDAEARAGLAEARLRLEGPAAAQADFLAALRGGVEPPDVRWFLRQAKKLQGLAARADVDLDRRQKLDRALAFFDRAAALVPSCARAHVERARIFAGDRRGAEAEEACAAAIRANRCAGDAFAIRGRLATASRDQAVLEGGVRDLSRAIELGARDYHVRYWRGVAFQKLGRPKEALADFEAAARAASGDALIWGQLQTLYLMLGDRPAAERARARYAELTDESKARLARELAARAERLAASDARGAIETISKAIELVPDDGDLYMRRAYLYLRGVERSNAVPDFARAIELKPALASKIYEAIPLLSQFYDFSRSLELAGESAPARSGESRSEGSRAFLRGFVYVLRIEGGQSAEGDTERGIAEFTAALEENPAAAAAYAFRGLLGLRSGDLNSAKDDLVTALQLENGCSVARVYMAGIQTQEGNFDLALAYLRQAIADGFNDWAQLGRDQALAPLKLDRRWKELLRGAGG